MFFDDKVGVISTDDFKYNAFDKSMDNIAKINSTLIKIYQPLSRKSSND